MTCSGLSEVVLASQFFLQATVAYGMRRVIFNASISL
jgi:hypothetical protein